MSRYLNKDTPFFDNVQGDVLAFGKVYFGLPNTDPLDQDNNAKAPYTDRLLTVPADSVQILDIAGKLPDRLYLSGAYAITVTDADDNVIDTDPYYVGESTNQIVNDSSAAGATLTDAINGLLARIVDLENNAVSLSDIWNIGGNLYMTTANENPGSRLGFGTWVAYGQGRVIIGVGTGTDGDSDQLVVAAGATGGFYNREIAITNMPEHAHHLFSSGIQATGNPDISGDFITARELDQTGNNDQYRLCRAATQTATAGLSEAVGGGTPITNVQPYIGVYLWSRTA